MSIFSLIYKNLLNQPIPFVVATLNFMLIIKATCLRYWKNIFLNTKLLKYFNTYRFFLYLFPPEPEFKQEDVGLPLQLTPFIRSNRISEARDRALVRGLQWSRLVSYAGFLTVNQGTF